MPIEALRDSIDLRDVIYRPSLEGLPVKRLPRILPLKSTKPRVAVRDQHKSDRCTGYALASLIDIQRGAAEFGQQTREPVPERPPVSARMLFEMGALVSAEINGTGQRKYSIRSAIKGFYHNGVCLQSSRNEEQAPGSTGLDMIDCAKEARGLSLGAYYRIQHHLSDYHNALQEVGAILVSAEMHAGWFKENVRKEGRIKPVEEFADHGAHAFVIVGYDETGFYVLNSWGPDWAGRVGHVERVPGIAHWSYQDWAESIMDAWVLRLGVPTPEAFEYTVGPQGSTYFGSASSAAGGTTNPESAMTAAPRQQVLGHYVHFESGRYVKTGSYPDSTESLERTLDYLRKSFVERTASELDSPPSDNPGINRVYLRITGDTGSVEDAMHRIVRLRRILRPQGIYPISILWTARMASAFAVGVKACMREAVRRMPDPTDDRNDLIEALIRPIGRPLWNQLKLEARSVAGFTTEQEGPLTTALQHLNKTFDQKDADDRSAGSRAAPEQRIELVVEGAGALVLIELLRQAGPRAATLLRHVRRVHIAFPVANHECLLGEMGRLKYADTRPAERASVEDLARRFWLIRPNRRFLDKSSIGPYTRTWFDLVNNSFESEPLERKTPQSLSIANSSEDLNEIASVGIPLDQQIEQGPDMKRQLDGSAILRNSVVGKTFIDRVLGKVPWHHPEHASTAHASGSQTPSTETPFAQTDTTQAPSTQADSAQASSTQTLSVEKPGPKRNCRNPVANDVPTL